MISEAGLSQGAIRHAAADLPGAGRPRKARVLHVITQLELGGAQQNTLYTCANLDRDRFEAALACGEGGYLDEEARSLHDVPVSFVSSLVRPIRPAKDLRALYDLARLISRWRPDIVHTHSSKAGIVGRWAARLAGVRRIVHSIHGFGFHEGQSWPLRRSLIAAERITAAVTTRFIAVSEANRRTGVALGLFPASRCSLIRSGIPLARYRRAERLAGTLRGELGLEASSPLVGMIACLKPQKAPLDFIAVARRVLEAEPRATFVLAGDGALRSDVEAAIEDLPSGRERIRLLGWRRDTDAILADLDVMLLTSLWEGLPRVLPEAMAAGRAIVATAVDGSPEAVEEGANGYLAAPGDIDRMARRVVELLRDPELRRRMGEEGRARAEAWDIDAMVRAQERLYLEMMGPLVPLTPAVAGPSGSLETPPAPATPAATGATRTVTDSGPLGPASS